MTGTHVGESKQCFRLVIAVETLVKYSALYTVSDKNQGRHLMKSTSRLADEVTRFLKVFITIILNNSAYNIGVILNLIFKNHRYKLLILFTKENDETILLFWILTFLLLFENMYVSTHDYKVKSYIKKRCNNNTILLVLYQL